MSCSGHMGTTISMSFQRILMTLGGRGKTDTDDIVTDERYFFLSAIGGVCRSIHRLFHVGNQKASLRTRQHHVFHVFLWVDAEHQLPKLLDFSFSTAADVSFVRNNFLEWHAFGDHAAHITVLSVEQSIFRHRRPATWDCSN